MVTDLNSVPDHPAAVIIAANPTFTQCATVLVEYEQEKGVTFAALDNDALAAVREAWDPTTYDAADDGLTAFRDLQAAVDALLGMSD